MDTLLSVENLSVSFRVEETLLPVLQNISFSVKNAEVHALVGESGCGKSVTSLAITKLLPVNIAEYNTGSVNYKGIDLLNTGYEELLKTRGKEIAYIFQDPFSTLNPLQIIKEQIIESYLIHISENEKEAVEKAKFLLNKVGLTDLDSRLNSYPSQMSGGMLQRISIAMALMCDPSLLIADEPTSAIDVTIQSQLIELLLKLKSEIKMSILFISHDLALVSALADRISVMYAGRIAETGSVDDVIDNPKHPYTIALIDSVPSFGKDSRRLKTIRGIVPSPYDYPSGCHFSTRCEKVFNRCLLHKPLPVRISESQYSSCFLFEEAK